MLSTKADTYTNTHTLPPSLPPLLLHLNAPHEGQHARSPSPAAGTWSTPGPSQSTSPRHRPTGASCLQSIPWSEHAWSSARRRLEAPSLLLGQGQRNTWIQRLKIKKRGEKDKSGSLKREIE